MKPPRALDPEIRLIAADNSDEVEAVVRMWRRSRDSAQPWLEARMGHTPADDLAFFRETLLAECVVHIAIDAGKPIGMLAVKGDQLEQLFIDPACQGGGVGSALLDLAKRQAPEGLSLFTHQRNQRARDFYERRGFRVVRLGVSAPPESEPDVEYHFPGR